MSNSATDPTSTTASSTSSGSSPRRTRTAKAPAAGGSGGPSPYPPSAEPSGQRAAGPVEVIACGALAGHIREIAARRGWPVVVRPLPAALHNRPEKIKDHAERLLAAPHAPGARAVLGYADCGSYGALDQLSARAGLRRLPGLHCYDLYAGPRAIKAIFAQEPGTYLLTDYLIRSFERSVIQPLGLDRHPDLWPDYFGHYTRLVWLAQQATTELEEAAASIARQFSLPLTRIDTGTSGLEAALAVLLDDEYEEQQ